jgi:hypothetical protein
MAHSTDTRFRMRAWDKINNEMHYDYQRIYIESGNEDEIPSGLIFNSDIYKHDFSEWPPDINKQVLLYEMEWVHAVDFIGMPIYEFDILEVTESDGSKWKGLAAWGNMGCSLCRNIDKIIDNNISSYCYFGDSQKIYRIIGNVYENMEMIAHLIKLEILKF